MDAFVSLAHVAPLSHLQLEDVKIDLHSFNQDPMQSFSHIEKMYLVDFSLTGTETGGDVTWCRIVSMMFPNLEQLSLCFSEQVKLISCEGRVPH